MADFNTWLSGLNLNTAAARHIDDDADGSFDCVDVAEDWCKFLWPGVSVNVILGYGNAKDLYANSSDQYFEKLPANIVAQPGDIGVYRATPTNSSGHIMVVINDDGTNLTCVEQNTYTQEAATIAHRTHNNLIGFLRPKGQGDMMDDKDITAIYIAALRSEADATNPDNLAYYRGKKPEELAHDLDTSAKAPGPNGEPSLSYKASHYDEDIANLKAQLASTEVKPVEAPAEASPPVFPEIHQPTVQVPAEAKLPGWLQFLVNLINKKG